MSWDFTGSRRPGPGVSPDAPHKKGFARFAEVLGRDAGSFLGANLLCFAGFLPAALAVSLGLVYENFWITLLGGVLGGALAGPFWNGMADTVLRTMQDDPTGWWDRWKTVLKHSWRYAAAAGALLGGLVASLLFVGGFFRTAATAEALSALPVLVVLAFDFFVLAVISEGLWPQISISMAGDAGLWSLLKNSARLALCCPARLFTVALVQLVWWAGLLVLFPTCVLPAPLLGFWPVALVSGQILYPALENVFDIPRYQILAKPASDLSRAKQQSEIWWRRYGGWVATALVCVSGAIAVTNVLRSRVQPDLQIAVVGEETLPDAVTATLQKAFVPYATDANGDGDVVVQINNYTVSFADNPANADAQMAGTTLLVADLQEGDSALWLLQDPAGCLAFYGDRMDAANSIKWADCPLLAGMDAGTFTQATAAFTGESTGQKLLANYTLLPAANVSGAAELFAALTKNS